MGFGKDSNRNTAADQAVTAQTDIAKKLFNQSDPLRQQLFGQSDDFLSGNFDVTGTPQFAAGKNIQEQQFQRARDATIANTAEGGGLTSALTNLEGQRASGLTNLTGQLAETQQNQAVGLGTFGAVQGQTGLANSASTQAQLAAAESSANAGKASGLGQAAGAMGAAAIGNK